MAPDRAPDPPLSRPAAPASSAPPAPASAVPPAPACRITPKYAAFVDTQPIDAALDDLALAQHGVFTLDQIAAAGLSKGAARDRAAKGALHRIHHGVYALTPPRLLTPNGRLMAAVLACGPLAALSHRQAARLHGLLDPRSARPEVTVPTTGGRARPGIQIHRSSTLDPVTDVTAVDGIRCTGLHRTIFDLAAAVTPRQLERALDQALILNRLDMRALADQIERNRGRSRNVGALQRVLATHAIGSTPTWNTFEERFLALIRNAGLPAPEVQQALDLRDGELPIYPDFLWRAQRVIVETDGWKDHGGRRAFERDRRRDQRAAAAGYQTIRATWRQLNEEPARLQATVLAVVTAGAASAATAPASAPSDAIAA